MIPAWIDLVHLAEWLVAVGGACAALLALWTLFDALETWYRARRASTAPKEPDDDPDRVSWTCQCGHANVNYGFCCPACQRVGPNFPALPRVRARVDLPARSGESFPRMHRLPAHEPRLDPRFYRPRKES